jgi:hypothetical protein
LDLETFEVWFFIFPLEFFALARLEDFSLMVTAFGKSRNSPLPQVLNP